MNDKIVKDSNAVVKTISLPDNVWDVVDGHSAEWQTNRSAAVRRIILEWQKSQQIPLAVQSHRIAA